MGLFGFRSAGSGDVVKHGRSDRATVVGILVTGGGAKPHIVDYALDVDADEPFRAGVRLTSEPPMVVRLGSTLQVLHLDSRVVIDWLGSGSEAVVDSQPHKTVPSPGIEDRSLGLGPVKISGVPVRATVESAEVNPGRRSGRRSLQLELFVERQGLSGYPAEIGLVGVPHYADHLCETGAELPVWVIPESPDDVVIDWPAAAIDDPGLGRPPSRIVTDLTRELEAD